MGGESEAAWRLVLDDLLARGLRTPEFLIIDGAAGLERALASLWPDVPAQRCTVHKHRNLLAHAPDALHEEVSADYTDMIYAATAPEGQAFLLIGTMFLIPVILMYTGWSYWVFRGKVRAGAGYH